MPTRRPANRARFEALRRIAPMVAAAMLAAGCQPAPASPQTEAAAPPSPPVEAAPAKPAPMEGRWVLQHISDRLGMVSFIEEAPEAAERDAMRATLTSLIVVRDPQWGGEHGPYAFVRVRGTHYCASGDMVRLRFTGHEEDGTVKHESLTAVRMPAGGTDFITVDGRKICAGLTTEPDAPVFTNRDEAVAFARRKFEEHAAGADITYPPLPWFGEQ